MRERPPIVAPSVARVRKPEKFSRCCDPVRIPQSFLDAAARRHYPRRTFPQHPKCAEKILDAHPSARPCHCHCLFARRYRAGDAFPPRPAKRHGLFSGRPHRAVVGAGVFDRRNGNLHPHDHRHAGHRLRRKSHLSSAGLRLPDRPRAHRIAAVARIFSRRIFHRLRADRKALR